MRDELLDRLDAAERRIGELQSELDELRRLAVAESEAAPAPATKADWWQDELGRYFLHAHRIRFRQPSSGEEVTVVSPLPRELEQWMGQIEG